jgi:hypothetical protein
MNNFERAEVILHLKVAGNYLMNYDNRDVAMDNIKAALSILSRG